MMIKPKLWKNGDFLFLSGTKNVVLGGSKGETIIYPSLTE